MKKKVFKEYVGNEKEFDAEIYGDNDRVLMQ
jgi:hypothetical protein